MACGGCRQARQKSMQQRANPLQPSVSQTKKSKSVVLPPQMQNLRSKLRFSPK